MKKQRTQDYEQCYLYCLASILEVDPNELPELIDETDPPSWSAYFQEQGIALYEFSFGSYAPNKVVGYTIGRLMVTQNAFERDRIEFCVCKNGEPIFSPLHHILSMDFVAHAIISHQLFVPLDPSILLGAK